MHPINLIDHLRQEDLKMGDFLSFSDLHFLLSLNFRYIFLFRIALSPKSVYFA